MVPSAGAAEPNSVGAWATTLPRAGVSMSITSAARAAMSEETGAGSQAARASDSRAPSRADSSAGVGRSAGFLARQAVMAGRSPSGRPVSTGSWWMTR